MCRSQAFDMLRVILVAMLVLFGPAAADTSTAAAYWRRVRIRVRVKPRGTSTPSCSNCAKQYDIKRLDNSLKTIQLSQNNEERFKKKLEVEKAEISRKLDAVHAQTRLKVDEARTKAHDAHKRDKEALLLKRNLHSHAAEARKLKHELKKLDSQLRTTAKQQRMSYEQHRKGAQFLAERIGKAQALSRTWAKQEEGSKADFRKTQALLKTTQNVVKEVLEKKNIFTGSDKAKLLAQKHRVHIEVEQESAKIMTKLKQQHAGEIKKSEQAMKSFNDGYDRHLKLLESSDQELNNKLQDMKKTFDATNERLTTVERNLYEKQKQLVKEREQQAADKLMKLVIAHKAEDFRRRYEASKQVSRNKVTIRQGEACHTFSHTPLAMDVFSAGTVKNSQNGTLECLLLNLNSLTSQFCSFRNAILSMPNAKQSFLDAKFTIACSIEERSAVTVPMRRPYPDSQVDEADVRLDVHSGFSIIKKGVESFFKVLTKVPMYSKFEKQIDTFVEQFKNTPINECGPRTFNEPGMFAEPLEKKCEMLLPWKQVLGTVLQFLRGLDHCNMAGSTGETCQPSTGFADLTKPAFEKTSAFLETMMETRAAHASSSVMATTSIVDLLKTKPKAEADAATSCGHGIPYDSDNKQTEMKNHYCGARYVDISHETPPRDNYVALNIKEDIAALVQKVNTKNLPLVFDVKQENCASPIILPENIDVAFDTGVAIIKLDCNGNEGYCRTMKRCHHLDYVPNIKIDIDVYVDENNCCKGEADLKRCKCSVSRFERVDGFYKHIPSPTLDLQEKSDVQSDADNLLELGQERPKRNQWKKRKVQRKLVLRKKRKQKKRKQKKRTTEIKTRRKNEREAEAVKNKWEKIVQEHVDDELAYGSSQIGGGKVWVKSSQKFVRGDLTRLEDYFGENERKASTYSVEIKGALFELSRNSALGGNSKRRHLLQRGSVRGS